MTKFKIPNKGTTERAKCYIDSSTSFLRGDPVQIR